MKRTLFRNLAQVVTGESATDSGVLRRAAVLVEDEVIARVGTADELMSAAADADQVDCAGGVMTPGFIDSHTHAVFGRWRADEYALRCAGVPYMEIARRGGGINASVRDLRARSEEELVALTRPRLLAMLQNGTTTAEVKSGYGLTTEDELKMLRVVRRLAAEGPLELHPTLLAAHEFPPEYAQRRDEYVDLVIRETIPATAAEGLARFCDVFMEPGVFTAEQTRRILRAGREHGLVPKLHADELEWSGGAEVGAELDAASADHLGRISDAGIAALAASNTVATLLPATLFFLGRKSFAPARRLLDTGAEVALATDFNPGSAPSPRMALVLTIACSHMGLSPLEALVAATRGGARALRLPEGQGTLRAGAPADLVLWNTADHAEIVYRFGESLVSGVWKRGRKVL